MSNGGMFIWTRVMERLAGSVASAGTVCSAPLRGYDPAPDSPISIIDFHGRLDSTIPMSPEGPDNLGPGNQNILILIRFISAINCTFAAGPDNTTLAMEGFYYHIKESHLAKVRGAMHCEETSSAYPTHMDGVEGWACRRWGGCDGGNEVVSCSGDYGHNYPFFPLHYVDGLQIMWDFMKAHPKKNI